MAVISQVELLQSSDQSSSRDEVKLKSNFGICLMLSIAYSASIGGVATLIGTPPNAILAGMVEKLYGQSISFASWLAFGLPLSVVMLAVTWFYLTRIAYPLRAAALPGVDKVIRSVTCLVEFGLTELASTPNRDAAFLCSFCNIVNWVINLLFRS